MTDEPVPEPPHAVGAGVELSEVFRRAPVGLVLIDAVTARVLAANQALVQTIGRAYDDVLGCPWPEPLGGTRGDFDELMDRLAAGGSATVDQLMGQGEVPVWWRQHVTLVERPDDDPYLIVQVDDRTAERLRTSELERLAERDELTGAWNRRRFSREFLWALEQPAGAVVGLVLFDVDGFKAVNDAHGHLVGDVALVRVAAALREAAPEGALVARLAGDEFAVLICGSSPEVDAVERACRDLARATRTVPVSDALAEVSLSAGWTVTVPGPDPERRVQDALIEADAAMYAAKARHRAQGRARIDPAAGPVARSFLADHGPDDLPAFEVWAHPVVRVDDGSVVMHDVVLHPTGPDSRAEGSEDADASPDPLAQPLVTLQVIVDVLDRVHRDACRHIGTSDRYLVHLPSFPLGVSSAVGWLRRAADDLGLEPGTVTFALGEGLLCEAGGAAVQMVAGLRTAGFGVGIDDFGGRLGSLRLICDLPHDQLWFASAVNEHLREPGADRTLVEATVRLAAEVGSAVGLPGTDASWFEYLGELGVSYALVPERAAYRPLGGVGNG